MPSLNPCHTSPKANFKGFVSGDRGKNKSSVFVGEFVCVLSRRRYWPPRFSFPQPSPMKPPLRRHEPAPSPLVRQRACRRQIWRWAAYFWWADFWLLRVPSLWPLRALRATLRPPPPAERLSEHVSRVDPGGERPGSAPLAFTTAGHAIIDRKRPRSQSHHHQQSTTDRHVTREDLEFACARI